MQSYLNLLVDILENGEERNDRTGVGTLAVFDRKITFDLQNGFPATTVKPLAIKMVAAELQWFLEGSTDANRLSEIVGKDQHIWSANASANYWLPKVLQQGKKPGYVGKIYGYQARRWAGNIDQLRIVVDKIKTDPHDRRLVVTHYNPSDLEDSVLPPCHMFYQFFVRTEQDTTFLDCKFYMRSVDMFLGFPFDIASYALLTHIVAMECGLKPGKVSADLGDTHIYKNHLTQVLLMIRRKPLMLPSILWLKLPTIDSFKYDDFDLLNYETHEKLTGAMAV